MTAPDPAVLDDLIARLEAATGPDREIDRQIACGFGGWHRVTHSQHGLASKKPRFIAPEDWIGRGSDGRPILDGTHGTTLHADVPRLTACVSAGLEVAKTALPHWSVNLSLSEGYRYPSVIMGRSHPTNAKVAVEHATDSLALCLCLALLRALRQGADHA